MVRVEVLAGVAVELFVAVEVAVSVGVKEGVQRTPLMIQGG
jgi:hypothetical protein